MKKLVLTTFVLIIIFGCNEHQKDTSVVASVIMIVDMTSSLDSLSMDRQARKVERFVNTLPYGSNLVVYPVSGNTSSESIFDYRLPLLNTTITHKKRAIDNKIKKAADSLRKIIVTMYDENKKLQKGEFQSCIISSLEMSYEILKSRKDTISTHLIYFSDMVEQCSSSRSGKMYMCSSSKIPDYEEIEKQVTEQYGPDFNLESLIGDKISFVTTSSKTNESPCLPAHKRKEIWKKILKKVGFSDIQLSGVHFNQELPKLNLNQERL